MSTRIKNPRDEDIAQQLGIRLTEVRKKAEEERNQKISRAKVAEEIGCSHSAVAQWENGHNAPSALVLRKLAEFYNVSADYLLNLTDYEQVASLPDKDSLIPWEAGAIPLSEANREAVRLFQLIASGVYWDWDALLEYLNDPRYFRSSDVIRLIEEALARDLIRVNELERDSHLEKDLKTKFNYLNERATVVVKLPVQFKNFPDFQQLLVALSTASFFRKIVQPGDDVALSGGSTLLRFARCMTYDEKLKGLTFFPLDINPLASQVELNASSIVALLKVRLKCKGFAFHHDSTGKRFEPKNLNKEAFDVLFRAARQCKLAFVGVGDPPNRAIFRGVGHEQYLSPKELEELGVVADLLFKLLDSHGNEIEHTFNESVASIPLADLRAMAKQGRVVGVVHGDGKAEALRAVLEGEYLSGIVTHDSLAKKVLDISL